MTVTQRNQAPGRTALRLGAGCLLALALCVPGGDALGAKQDGPRTMSEILEASTPSDWRSVDPENTLYLQIDAGRVIIELAPDFVPLHAANIRMLVREGYFDGLSIIRSQDNFVVQWGDPEGKRSLGKASPTLPPEFTVAWARALPFTRLPDVDGYATAVGFSTGFPVGGDPVKEQAWLAHCYGMVGAGRSNEIDSGNGAELYVVIGNAPRQLDRNIALVGRVVQGMELLSTLPRGAGPLGFYEKPEQYVPIKSVRIAADLPPGERVALEVMRTDTPAFRALVETRRNRKDDWYMVPAGHVELCNVPIPVRQAP
jgi:peptidylprolyl isomerase